MRRGKPQQLAYSWQANAQAWSRVVREQRLESRRLVTDAAVLQAVLNTNAKRVLDVGCGEGWLCRALAERGVDAVGVDASAPLIQLAREADPRPQCYYHCAYKELAQVTAEQESFQLLVANFALLEDDILPSLHAFKQVLAADGSLLIQTLHPWPNNGPQVYEDGWRLEQFSDFGEAFVEPMPWYFRTLASWLELLTTAGWTLQWLREPLHPQRLQPLSLLMQFKPAAAL